MASKEKRRFTITELKKFDGIDGRPAYSAFRGKVFDVSFSPFWENGKHEGIHSAGFDLTESIMNAPHNEEVFSNFKIVGELVLEEEVIKKSFVQKLQKWYLHPIFVHFSTAIPILAFFLAVFSVIPPSIPVFKDFMNIITLNDQGIFERVSYLLLILGFFAALAGFLSGIFSWKVTYEGRMTKIFARKIWLSIVLIAIFIVCLIWRAYDPNVLNLERSVGYFYLALEFSFVVIVVILGHYGGKIVYA